MYFVNHELEISEIYIYFFSHSGKISVIKNREHAFYHISSKVVRNLILCLLKVLKKLTKRSVHENNYLDIN